MRLIVIVLAFSLAACAARDVAERDKAAEEAPAYQNPAVVALLEEAERQREAGQPGLAASALERAIRISPRDPVLRISLARLRLEQGNPFQAKELARMAVVHSGNRHGVQAEAWDVIAAAERDIGNQVEARLAEQEAERLRR